MKKLLIIHTGGTISMKESVNGITIDPNHHPLFNHPSILRLSIEEVNLFHIPSPHMTPTHMIELGAFINEQLKTDTFYGVVITHGTDTLEETSYFIDLYVNTTLPIIFTGAMRSSNDIGSDGLYNLSAAINVASTPEAHGRGVLIVMNDEIHDAQYVIKTSTNTIDTFKSPLSGPVGLISNNHVHFLQNTVPKESFYTPSLSRNVILLKAFTGMTSEIIDSLNTNHIDGIVIEAFGLGNVPPEIAPSLIRLSQKGFIVLIVSRCMKGFVHPVYQYEGGGRALQEKGILFSNYLNGPKARLKLLLLLERQLTKGEIKQAFL